MSATDTPESTAATPEPVVVVDHVNMVFNMASERLNSLKEYFLALVKGKLMF